MDISSSYNCLLGRPWIHIAGAIPSTLHQKIKFMTEGQLICITAEEDMIAATSSEAPYVGEGSKIPCMCSSLECSFRSLEFVNAMYVGEGSKIPVSKLSKTTQSSVKQVTEKRARARRGLGKGL